MVAQKLANLVRNEVDPEKHIVTVAIGISVFPQHGDDSETLLKAADRAMYEAKKEQVSIHARVMI